MGYITTVLPREQRAKAGPKNGAIATATVSIDPLGGVSVDIASAPAGPGPPTVCAQVVADVFGVEPDDDRGQRRIRYRRRMPGRSPPATIPAASPARWPARCTWPRCKVRDKLARIAAAQFGCEPEDVVLRRRQGLSHGTTPDAALPFTRAGAQPALGARPAARGHRPGPARDRVLDAAAARPRPTSSDRINTSAAYGFVFDICAVEIDRDTGRVRIDRYVTAHDAGTLLNPALADGQIRGAFAQGLGAALMEEFRYGEDGSFQSGTFADYLVPTTCEVPEPVILHMETPSPFTPLGAKGLGEGNNMSTPVCIANAVADALGRRRHRACR